MREPCCCGEVRRRLARHGLPALLIGTASGITLGVLPLLLAPLLMAALALPLWGLNELLHTLVKEGAAAFREAIVLVSAVWLAHSAALLGVACAG